MKKEDKPRFLFNFTEIYSSNTPDWIIKNEFNPFLRHDEDDSVHHPMPIINDEQRSNLSSNLLNNNNDDYKHNNFYVIQNDGKNGPQPVMINDPRVLQNINNQPDKNISSEDNSYLFQRRWNSMNRHESNFKIYRMAPCFKTVIHIIIICVLLFLLIWLMEPHQPETLDMPLSNNIENNQSQIHEEYIEVNDVNIKNETSNNNNIGIFDFNKPLSILKSFLSNLFNKPSKKDEKNEQHDDNLWSDNENSQIYVKEEDMIHNNSANEHKNKRVPEHPDLVFDNFLEVSSKLEEKLNLVRSPEEDKKVQELTSAEIVEDVNHVDLIE